MKEHFSIFTGKSTWSSISFNQFQWRNTQELKRNSPVIHSSAGCIFLWGTSKVKKHIAIATRWKYCSYYRAQERWTWKSMSSSFTSQREIICNTLVFGAIWPYSMTLTLMYYICFSPFILYHVPQTNIPQMQYGRKFPVGIQFLNS